LREHSPNNSPRLAIREGESVFVWVLRFRDQAAYERFLASLEHSERWTNEIAPALTGFLGGSQEIRRLVPTSRSRLRTSPISTLDP
jgi:hypothetical protein